MHEMAITESVVTAVSEQTGGSRVVGVTMKIGTLSGVVADSVRFCFEICVAGTRLEGAQLDIIEIPGRAHCRGCGLDVDLPDLIPLCTCGSIDLDIVSGQELLIKHVEVA